MNEPTPRITELAYGNIADNLVFIPKEEALEMARLHEALQTATTWGQFRSRAPEDGYRDALERLTENEEKEKGEEMEEPNPEARFDAERIGGFGDGDWPGWPAQQMEYWVPDEVQDRFGSMKPTAISGDFLDLPPENEAEIVAAMERHGYKCLKDEDLVWKASGY